MLLLADERDYCRVRSDQPAEARARHGRLDAHPLWLAVSGCRRTTRESQRSLINEVRGAEMPRGHYLAEAVKDAIWVLRAEGVSEAEIGRRLGLPKRTVSKYLERWEGSGRGPGVGLSVV